MLLQCTLLAVAPALMALSCFNVALPCLQASPPELAGCTHPDITAILQNAAQCPRFAAGMLSSGMMQEVLLNAGPGAGGAAEQVRVDGSQWAVWLAAGVSVAHVPHCWLLEPA